MMKQKFRKSDVCRVSLILRSQLSQWRFANLSKFHMTDSKPTLHWFNLRIKISSRTYEKYTMYSINNHNKNVRLVINERKSSHLLSHICFYFGASGRWVAPGETKEKPARVAPFSAIDAISRRREIRICDNGKIPLMWLDRLGEMLDKA